MGKYDNCEPGDFYFYVGYSEEYEGNFVVICNIDYWDQYKHIADHHLSIRNLLPNYMGECEESLFEFPDDKSLEEVRNTLLTRGFKENEEFSKFCSTHDPF